MNETNPTNSTLNLETFNLTREFEDIEFVINELSGEAEMAIASRRC